MRRLAVFVVVGVLTPSCGGDTAADPTTTAQPGTTAPTPTITTPTTTIPATTTTVTADPPDVAAAQVLTLALKGD